MYSYDMCPIDLYVCVCVGTCIHACVISRLYAFIHLIWLMHMCDMTQSCVWHDSFICVTGLIHMGDMNYMYATTRLINMCRMNTCTHMDDKEMCDMTHSYEVKSFTCVPRLSHMCRINTSRHMDHTCVDYTCVKWLIHMGGINYMCATTQLINMFRMNTWRHLDHTCVHDTCVTWLIYVGEINYTCATTRLINMCRMNTCTHMDDREMCDMTHSYEVKSFTCVPRLSFICAASTHQDKWIIPVHMGKVNYLCATTRLLNMCRINTWRHLDHTCVQDTCVTWLIYMCDMNYMRATSHEDMLQHKHTWMIERPRHRRMHHVARTNESCHTRHITHLCDTDTAIPLKRHVTYMSETWLIGMGDTSTVSRMNTSCLTYEWLFFHIRIRHTIYMNESCHTTYE